MSEIQKPQIVTLTIDGQEVKVAPGSTIIKAAEKASKYIPHFCYHEGLSVVGQCRMCFVEIEGAPKLATACSTPVTEGMKVLTESPKVKAGQNATLEFTLLNHPLDCPICDRGGECKLQDYTYEYGPPLSRLYDDKVLRDKHKAVSEQIILDQERCILCTRCVRFSSEVDGRGELVVNNRGNANVIDVFENRPLESAFSGNVVDLCPVGALTAKDFRFEARPWELKKHEALCTGCGVGCNIEIHTKHRHTGIARPDASLPHPQIERLMPRENRSVNDWWMCDSGRWGYHFHNQSEKRLQDVWVRTNSSLQKSSLKEAQTKFDSQKFQWEFWVSDSFPLEGISWAKELLDSWRKRGREVRGFNPSPLGNQFLKVWATKNSSPWFAGAAEWNEIKKVISVGDYRQLESRAPLIALRLGPAVRAQKIQWEIRPNGNFHKGSDDLATTAYLVNPPQNEADLEALAQIPASAKVLILWAGPNARGLLNQGISPFEVASSGAQKLSHPSQAGIFLFHQSTQNSLKTDFLGYFKNASLKVMADSFKNEFTESSDIVLPLTPLYETSATLVNIENRTQNSKGIHIEHPNWDYLKRGSEIVNPALRLI